jgi:hypothetical protein
MATGDLLWTYGNGNTPGNTTNSGFQVPGPYPTFINAIGNGIVYLVTSEHTFQTPIYKGSLVRAVNATDGTEVFTIAAATGEFSGESFAIADGYTNFFNSYDHQIYTLGRGPSRTTVTAPDIGVQLGSSLVIRGTVTDLSAGTKQTEQAARFPDGVPVAADSIMSDWMSYIYQQQPMPTTFTGVDVTINVVDANGNYRPIGTVKTTSDGTYSLSWKPDIEGTYYVYATFAGTNGYWPSHASSSFVVDPAAATPTPEAPAGPSTADQYILPMVIAIIIAIAVVGAVLALLVRKRP